MIERIEIYDMDGTIEPERAESDVQDAHQFVAQIEDFLRQNGWLWANRLKN